MIKINTILNNKAWYHHIKNPNNFFLLKEKKLNQNFKKYNKNILFFTILLSGDQEIKNLNKRFRKKNQTTDVLSFPFNNKKDLKRILKREREIYLGDIVINLNKVRNYCINTNFKLELNKLWIHGLVHLFGYDHKNNRDFNEMLKIEKKFLSCLN